MSRESVTVASHLGGQNSPSCKRPATSPSDPERPQKIRRLSDEREPIKSPQQDDVGLGHPLPPSPSLTQSVGEGKRHSEVDSTTQKRKAGSLDRPPSQPLSITRSPVHAQSVKSSPAVEHWLSQIPAGELVEDPEDMALPPSKRSRSSDNLSRGLSQSGASEGTEPTISRDKKFTAYRDVNYEVLLEMKGSHMRGSVAGLVPEDKILCQELLRTEQPKPVDPLFNDRYDRLYALLRGRSEARIYLDLHPLLLPSAERLGIMGREEFSGIIEGHNDAWVKAITFHGPRPQPDHTYGFKWSNFSETQRRRLNIDGNEKSLYTAREEIYFPFLTSEIKCGKQGLDLADRPNAHSMTIALRGIVDLYRRANRALEVHGRALGFSISHDDQFAKIYVHYPEIDGDRTTFWRETVKVITLADNEDNWKCGQFTLNVCQTFAPKLLSRLRDTIDQLVDPVAP